MTHEDIFLNHRYHGIIASISQNHGVKQFINDVDNGQNTKEKVGITHW